MGTPGRPRELAEKSIVVSFKIEPAQRAFIRDLAQRLRVPESRIFREAINRFMVDPNHNLHMQPAVTEPGEAAD
jgi:hypothetical protein